MVRHALLIVTLVVATAGSALAQPQVVILTPPAAATTPLEIAGYAYDPRATVDSGIAQLEIWAFKDAKPPGKKLGVATLGFDRIDFARFLGLPANFNNMGFALTISGGRV